MKKAEDLETENEFLQKLLGDTEAKADDLEAENIKLFREKRGMKEKMERAIAALATVEEQEEEGRPSTPSRSHIDAAAMKTP